MRYLCLEGLVLERLRLHIDESLRGACNVFTHDFDQEPQADVWYETSEETPYSEAVYMDRHP